MFSFCPHTPDQLLCGQQPQIFMHHPFYTEGRYFFSQVNVCFLAKFHHNQSNNSRDITGFYCSI